ncbi:MAG TPA: GNAT family N-acetyltransferase [Blastocatellia bacterium]|nr:GNAT family N-acetyltransferase [Blastocatellia bacterium]
MNGASDIIIRSLTAADEPFLWETLYQALYVPEGADPFPRDVVRLPEISRYVDGWGRLDDQGFVAAIDETCVGATWIRLLKGANKGYGYVDETTPELTIAVMPAFRGRGIGTKLLARLMAEAKNRYQAVSLSVSADNPALRLYQRFGFRVVATSGNSLTMIKMMYGTSS